MFDIGTVTTKSGIVAALNTQRVEVGGYLAAFPTKEFLAPQGEHWSPEGHLRHLIKSVRAVAKGLRMPRLLLAASFGISRRGSSDFEATKQRYLAGLAAGGQAGRYGPSDGRPEMPAEEWRQVVLDRWKQAMSDLAAAAEAWPEKALDRYRLPHPLIGKLTLREMLFFTLYHNAHHARRIRERAAADEKEIDSNG